LIAIFSNINGCFLKYRLLSSLKTIFLDSKWTQQQDHLLFQVMFQLYPSLFIPQTQTVIRNINWSVVSFEFNRTVFSFEGFKSNRKCKERWNNHL